MKINVVDFIIGGHASKYMTTQNIDIINMYFKLLIRLNTCTVLTRKLYIPGWWSVGGAGISKKGLCSLSGDESKEVEGGLSVDEDVEGA